MCGLTLTIRPFSDASSSATTALLDSFRTTNMCRGPDCQRSHTEMIDLADGKGIEVTLSASVLGLRGELTSQPMVGKRGILGWNGQVFQGLEVGKEENDTRKIFDRLESGEEPDNVLKGIEGPFAFIYLDLINQRIHYQLDPLSRRSLLIHPPNVAAMSEFFVLSSCRSPSAREENIDMRALLGGEGGVMRLRDTRVVMHAGKQVLNMKDTLCPRMNFDLPESSSTPWTRVSPINASLPASAPSIDDPALEHEVETFTKMLRDGVRRRVENIPTPSHPADSRVAVLFSGGIDCTFLAYLLHQCLPPTDPVDLVNVAFGPSPKAPVIQGKGKDEEIPPVLVNYDVPDRISGRDAVTELRAVCPGREWRFVEVDVSYEETRLHRERVLDLMYPSSTEMDLSLAYPLYFASLGHGSVQQEGGTRQRYHVQAKVYLSGLGADEQLGGYARHRHAFHQGGWQGLINETQLDITRLPTRNLSRDDRIISSHARDARYPYLDLTFISYLSSLNIWTKCDPRLGEGIGDKRLLRRAVKKCGMRKSSERVKKAMQFGTRSAKVGGSGSGVRGPKAGERQVE
ncbi:hypothetical protein IAR55_006284 [Kwoniella newhampshirensis]|uniref:Asparagine synthetase domain-containing protein n=1 Tax=Kwoniella newhampshirensis TaxID=1651941 RepID=A0AAW0YG54_9TREE